MRWTDRRVFSVVYEFLKWILCACLFDHSKAIRLIALTFIP